jgi:S1-C subfamily serine protease
MSFSAVAMVASALLLFATQSSVVKSHGTPPSPMGQAPDNLPAILEMAAASTVVVTTCISYEASDDTGQAGQAKQPVAGGLCMHGTGFIADDEWHIVTASHVVDLESRSFINKVSEALKSVHQTLIQGSIKRTELKIAVMMPNISTASSGSLFDVAINYDAVFEKADLKNDISVLFCKQLFWNSLTKYGNVAGSYIKDGKQKHLFLQVATPEVRQPDDGDLVCTIGFPSLYMPLPDSRRRTWTAGPTMTCGRISNNLEYDPESDDRKEYLADVRVVPGNSGGPMIRQQDGKVLGVTVAVNKQNQSVVIPVTEVLKLLDGIPKEPR